MTAAGALLAAPGDLAAVRLLGVALGWWAAVGALVVVLAALMLDRPDGGTHPGPSRG